MIFLGWHFSKINSDTFGCKNFTNSNIMYINALLGLP